MYRTPYRVTREDIAEIYDHLGDTERAAEVRDIQKLEAQRMLNRETIASLKGMRNRSKAKRR